MMPALTNTAAGSTMIADPSGNANHSLYIASNTVHYLYHHDEDDYQTIASGGFAVALAAGFCGAYHPWSVNYTANGGSTTTVTVAAGSFNLNGNVRGKQIEFLTGTAANLGLRRTISEITHNNGIGTITLTLSASVPSSVANNDTFRVASGSYFMLNAGTLAATNYFKRFDLGTQAWSDRAVTGLPATWGTDGRMVIPSRLDVSYDSGTVTSATGTTLDCTGKGWTSGQWVNYQVRITGGLGIGQIRVITANDADTLTVATWTTNPDSTSTFVIEGDDNAIYIMGNNAVTLYKNSISGNTTTTVTVSAARAGAPVAGMSADFVSVTGIYNWNNITNIKDGRYIYSLRGTGAIMDVYDIATLAWLPTTGVNYPANTTFAAGDSTFHNGRYIYIAKEGSATVPQRFYKFALRGNYIEPVTTDWYLGGAATIGNKIWVKNLSTTGTIKWLYCLQSTSANLRRIMIF
jgi:hypothetical protein